GAGAMFTLARRPTIMRSGCGGEAPNTSAPKREMSKRGPTIAIISIAQHARPKPSGQMAFARALFTAHATIFSALVNSTPFSTSSRTASSEVGANPSRGSGMATGSGVRMRSGFELLRSVIGSLQRSRGRSRPSIPVERALLQQIEVAHEQDEDEEQHLDQAVQPELAERHGPRVEEHRLDVEEDEEHRDQIELDREAGARVADRLDAALIRSELGRVLPPRHDERGHADRAGGEQQRHREEHQHRQVRSHRLLDVENGANPRTRTLCVPSEPVKAPA